MMALFKGRQTVRQDEPLAMYQSVLNGGVDWGLLIVEKARTSVTWKPRGQTVVCIRGSLQIERFVVWEFHDGRFSQVA